MFRFGYPVLVAAVVVAVSLASRTLAEPKEGNTPPDKGDWTLSSLRVHEMPECTYLHTTFETTFEQLAQITPIIEDLIKTVADNHIMAEGYVMMIYKGVGPDRSKPFELSIGVVVPADTKPVGKYEIKRLEKFKTASALFNGGFESLGFAYQKHYGDVMAAGHMPTDETRELHLYFEGETSGNNVVWIQAGIQ